MRHLPILAAALMSVAAAAPAYAQEGHHAGMAMPGHAHHGALMEAIGDARRDADRARDQWRHPAQFAEYGLQRVEMLNADASQGFAFDASGDVCERMGKMGQKYRELINPRTSAP